MNKGWGLCVEVELGELGAMELDGVSFDKRVAAGDADSPESNGVGSTSVDFVAIGEESVASRAGEFASIVGRVLRTEELVRGTVGGLRGIEGEAFLALEVLASGVLT